VNNLRFSQAQEGTTKKAFFRHTYCRSAFCLSPCVSHLTASADWRKATRQDWEIKDGESVLQSCRRAYQQKQQYSRH